MLRFLRHKSTIRSPLKLVNGIYNPPQSMSKTAARKWSEHVQKQEPQKANLSTVADSKSAVVTPEDSGKTLVEVVSKYFGLSIGASRLKILEQDVWVENSLNSKFIDLKPKGIVKYGDRLCMMVNKPVSAQFKLVAEKAYIEKLKNSIIYKDDRIIIINKWDTATHGGSKNNRLNIDLFLEHLGQSSSVPKLVHRLDKGTTGCLIIARSAEAAIEFQKKQRENMIRKRYVAVVTPPLEHKAAEQHQIITGIVESQGQEGKQRSTSVPWSTFYLA